MRYEYRHFEDSDHDWSAYVALHNKAWPEYPTTEEEARHEATRWNPKFAKERFLMLRDGRPLGWGMWCEPAWSPRAGKYYLDWFVDPQSGNGADGAFGHFLMSLLQEKSPDTLEVEAREDQLARLEWLAARGFSEVMKANCSALAVDEFDGSAFAAKCERAVSDGIRIMTATQVQATYDDWFDRLYDLNSALVVDLPAPEPVVPESRERFASRFERPGYVGDAYFIAMDGDRPVGMSNLSRSMAEAHKLYVGLTGVRRSHRRRGLCTALKVRAIEWAADNGYQSIVTDNEANNPMYDINVALGFRPMPAFLVLHAEVSP